MTQGSRGVRNLMPRLIVALALILFCWTHRDAFYLSGFADDLGLLSELPARSGEGRLLAGVFAKFVEPLWPGSTMWRPLSYASFALDAALWGNNPGLWRITNLLLHIITAAFTALIAARLTRQSIGSAGAFATFLLMPWAPEITIWLVGRFDGWATLAMLVAVWTAMHSRGSDRWFCMSLAAAVVAYASKESALVLPLWIVLVMLVKAWQPGVSSSPEHIRSEGHKAGVVETVFSTIRANRWLVTSHVLLALAYLGWRSYLFAGQAIGVYASAPEYRPWLLIGRTLSHVTFPAGIAALSIVAAFTVAAISWWYLLLALRGVARSVAVTGLCMAVSVLIAVAMHFANPPDPGSGEGYRLYYLATVGMSLVVAAAIRGPDKTSVAILVAFMVALSVWQSRVAAEWTRASATIDAAARAMTAKASNLAQSEFGLVLMPDMMGHVPVARNAQGALLTLRDGTSPARDFFIIFTPPQLAEWHRLANENVVSKLTARSTAPANPTRYFCFDSRKQTLEDLGYWPPGTLVEWTARWREATTLRCPELTR